MDPNDTLDMLKHILLSRGSETLMGTAVNQAALNQQVAMRKRQAQRDAYVKMKDDEYTREGFSAKDRATYADYNRQRTDYAGDFTNTPVQAAALGQPAPSPAEPQRQVLDVHPGDVQSEARTYEAPGGATPEWAKMSPQEAAKAIARGTINSHTFDHYSAPEAVRAMGLAHPEASLDQAEGRVNAISRRVDALPLTHQYGEPEAEMSPPGAGGRQADPAPLASPAYTLGLNEPLRAHPSAHPNELRYGHIADAINKYGPDAVYGSMARNHTDPLDFMQTLGGSLNAQRMRHDGPDAPDWSPDPRMY